MMEWVGIEGIPADWGRCVVTIGVLDGVHRGHTQLVDHAVRRARELGVPSILVTFDRHPAVILDPDRAPAMLGTAARKFDLIAERGVDAMMALHFTRDMSELSAKDFVKSVLVDALHAAAVVVGENFIFGYRASGDVAQLRALGERYGFTVDALPLVNVQGGIVSATRIRNGLASGNVEEVKELLGHPYRADGIVIRGEQRGRQLGYPTANLRMPDNAAIPDDGVYAGRVVRLTDSGHAAAVPALGIAAMSVGTNPTFNGRYRSVEACILDFDGDLYGELLGVEFHHRLRGMERFDTIEDLVVQMARDVAQTRVLMNLDKPAA